MRMAKNISVLIPLILLCTSIQCQAFANSLVETIKKVKPSIVGVGKYNPTSSPRAQILGTGFAILNGSYIATNHHVIPETLSEQQQEKLVVFTGHGNDSTVVDAFVVAVDPEHDLAILRIHTKALKPLTLESSQKFKPDGTEIAFTGFPIGSVLGLYPVTHKGIISALTPTATPAANSQQLNLARLKRLRNPFLTYQLDATAYPGNSGSPVYLADSGTVIAVINKVFVKQSKENVLSDPSAITYAIPVTHLTALTKLINRK